MTNETFKFKGETSQLLIRLLLIIGIHIIFFLEYSVLFQVFIVFVEFIILYVISRNLVSKIEFNQSCLKLDYFLKTKPLKVDYEKIRSIAFNSGTSYSLDYSTLKIEYLEGSKSKKKSFQFEESDTFKLFDFLKLQGVHTVSPK